MHKNFAAIAAAALALSLYAAPAACEEDAGGSEVSEESGYEPTPLGYTEEARIMRQEGAASGPWYVEEARADRHRDSPQTKPQKSQKPKTNTRPPWDERPFRTTILTVLGVPYGVVVGYVSGMIICEGVFAGGWDCYDHSGVITSAFAGGIAGGDSGYHNNVVGLVAGGAVMGGFGLVWAHDHTSFPQTGSMLIGAFGGGTLGYWLWRSGEPSDTQASLSPYLHDEGAGLMLSGRF